MTNILLPKKATKKKKETSHEKQEIKILNPGSKDYPMLPIIEQLITYIFKKTICFKSKRVLECLQFC